MISFFVLSFTFFNDYYIENFKLLNLKCHNLHTNTTIRNMKYRIHDYF